MAGDLSVDGRNGGEHFGIAEESGFVKARLPFMDKVDQPARAVDERHPDFGADLVR